LGRFFLLFFRKKYFKKVEKNNSDKISIFGLFEESLWFGLDSPGGKVNIIVDADFLIFCQLTYLKIGVDYEFDIKTAKFNYIQFPKRAVLAETHT
jgi:hypothetical protein